MFDDDDDIQVAFTNEDRTEAIVIVYPGWWAALWGAKPQHTNVRLVRGEWRYAVDSCVLRLESSLEHAIEARLVQARRWSQTDGGLPVATLGGRRDP